MGDPKKPYPDLLVRQRLFPDPAQIFAFNPTSLTDALSNGVVVVDTNVLLVPYTTGRASLEQIRQTFEQLTKEGRLRIPGQVAREFADNRAEKLKILYQQLSRKRDIHLSRNEYPLLEGISEYAEVTRREAAIDATLDEYRKAVGTLLDTVAAWHWDDPVSRIYRDLFKAPTLIDPDIDREKLIEELRYRQDHRIPPGYKDSGNEYGGIGDLLIWKAILRIGEVESRHVVFVSGDEKTDWRYQSENRALYPRFELLDEFRVASNGKSILMISFAELLQQCGAAPPVVAEVRAEEAVVASEKVEASIAAEFPRLSENLDADLLRGYLERRYPNRTHFVDREAYIELAHELETHQIHTIAELDRMLTISEEAFELSEAEDPPASPGGGTTRYGDLGIVRRSLAIFNDKYRRSKYGDARNARWQRWRALL